MNMNTGVYLDFSKYEVGWSSGQTNEKFSSTKWTDKDTRIYNVEFDPGSG